MSLEEMKAACGRYYASTESKEVGGDKRIYKTMPSLGIRHLPLGYFDTEEEAVQVLYDYLTNKNLI